MGGWVSGRQPAGLQARAKGRVPCNGKCGAWCRDMPIPHSVMPYQEDQPLEHARASYIPQRMQLQINERAHAEPGDGNCRGKDTLTPASYCNEVESLDEDALRRGSNVVHVFPVVLQEAGRSTPSKPPGGSLRDPRIVPPAVAPGPESAVLTRTAASPASGHHVVRRIRAPQMSGLLGLEVRTHQRHDHGQKDKLARGGAGKGTDEVVVLQRREGLVEPVEERQNRPPHLRGCRKRRHQTPLLGAGYLASTSGPEASYAEEEAADALGSHECVISQDFLPQRVGVMRIAHTLLGTDVHPRLLDELGSPVESGLHLSVGTALAGRLYAEADSIIDHNGLDARAFRERL